MNVSEKIDLAVHAAKLVVGGVVGFGTGFIVKQIIDNNVDPEKPREKVGVLAASFVIGGMAADATARHTDKQLDSAANFVKQKLFHIDPEETEIVNPEK